MLCFSGCRLLGSGFRDNKWILLSFGYTNVDFVVGRWISWISLFRQTAWTTCHQAMDNLLVGISIL